MKVKERITSSAININGAIIVGKRHCDCMAGAVESGLVKKVDSSVPQGFYTSEFRFIGREEAMVLAKENGQLLKEKSYDILFSEDLR